MSASATEIPPHTAKLPLGYTVTFSMKTADGGLATAWKPHAPRDLRPRPLRKLVAAYMTARAEFLSTIATVTNRRVLILDPDSAMTQLIEPESRH